MTRPRISIRSYGFSGSACERDTRGSRRRFRTFARPIAVLKATWSPSRSTHIGVTWGDPSGLRVARCQKLGPSSLADVLAELDHRFLPLGLGASSRQLSSYRALGAPCSKSVFPKLEKRDRFSVVPKSPSQGEERPVSWLVVEPGWRVESRDGVNVGTVAEVIGEPELDIFSGIALSTGFLSSQRLVEADAISEIRDGLIVLALDEGAVDHLPEHKTS